MAGGGHAFPLPDVGRLTPVMEEWCEMVEGEDWWLRNLLDKSGPKMGVHMRIGREM